jgi:hypothetical protein
VDQHGKDDGDPEADRDLTGEHGSLRRACNGCERSSKF